MKIIPFIFFSLASVSPLFAQFYENIQPSAEQRSYVRTEMEPHFRLNLSEKGFPFAFSVTMVGDVIILYKDEVNRFWCFNYKTGEEYWIGRGEGRGPGELESIGSDFVENDSLFHVSDYSQARVLVFDIATGKLVKEIRVEQGLPIYAMTKIGRFYYFTITGFLDNKFIHVMDENGKYIKSFYDIEKDKKFVEVSSYLTSSHEHLFMAPRFFNALLKVDTTGRVEKTIHHVADQEANQVKVSIQNVLLGMGRRVSRDPNAIRKTHRIKIVPEHNKIFVGHGGSSVDIIHNIDVYNYDMEYEYSFLPYNTYELKVKKQNNRTTPILKPNQPVIQDFYVSGEDIAMIVRYVDLQSDEETYFLEIFSLPTPD